jgi:transcriptional regulator with XRE-family HTH domain
MPKPKTPATVYGKRLRSARQSMGWTQAELAERIGMVDVVSGATRVSRYETGQHDPDPVTAEALAKALDLPVAYFHATSDVLADIILLVSRLPAAEQKLALERLREFTGKQEPEQ